jgi:dipeptide/tripeptide permease
MAFGLALGENPDQKTRSPFWLNITRVFFTLTKILISSMGKSYVVKVARRRIQSVMTGGWFCSAALSAPSSGISGRFYRDISHYDCLP